MCSQTTSPDTGSVTSSQASEGGPSQLDLLAGLTIENCGPEAARASRSARQAKASVTTTNGTCGPTSFACSVPDGPLSGWESRLRQRLAKLGSTECSLTWKASATPAGRPLSRLVPSMRPIAVTVSGSSPTEPALWITASARDWKDSPGMATERPDGRSRIDQLPRQVAAACWPTPTASADKSIRTPEGARTEVARGKSPDLAAHVMAMWPTPTHRDYMPAHTPEYIASKKSQGHGMSNLSDIEPLGMLPTAPGPALAGSSDTTGKPGALAPEFVAWLMGFPPEWLDCAPETMPRKAKSK